MNSTTEICNDIHGSCVSVLDSIDFEDTSFKTTLFFVAFNPIFWNIVSRLEYYTRFLTKLAKSSRRGCYILAATIFTLGMIRSYYFEKMLSKQAISVVLDNDAAKISGLTFVVIGQVLVLTSMYQLGIVGTYCGDYFGILMKDKVTAFPFNICHNPMYRGSTLTFLGVSLMCGKPAGVLTTVFVHFIYELALKFEEPFTNKIYAMRESKRE